MIKINVYKNLHISSLIIYIIHLFLNNAYNYVTFFLAPLKLNNPQNSYQVGRVNYVFYHLLYLPILKLVPHLILHKNYKLVNEPPKFLLIEHPDNILLS